MTNAQKHTVKITAMVALAIALFLLLRGRAPAPVATPDAVLPVGGNNFVPDYLTYNQPKYDPANLPLVSSPDGAAPVVSQTNPDATAPSCGCAGGGQLDNTLFAGLSDLSAFYNKTLKGFATKYTDNLLSALPGYFTQYFNNEQGAAASNASAQSLSNPAALSPFA